MKINKYIFSLAVILLIIWANSCSGRSGNSYKKPDQPTPAFSEEVTVKLIKMILPAENSGFKLNQPVKVVVGLEDKSSVPDSVAVNFDGHHVTTLKSYPWEYSVPPVFTVTTGRKSIKVTSYRQGKQKNSITRFIIIYSDIVPKRYGYRVINTYPHDRNAFTQGLIYNDGSLFEGTGQETGSTLREVELETGKVLRQRNLDRALFGEGIALYQNRIYQVTWQNHVGFVYNKSDFKVMNKIYYQTEGWGLTTIGDRIVMSDGSNILYFFEPDMFTVMSKIEVYDNEIKRDSLNELEYINGEIWANIWVNDRIARIDPVSGKVLGYINLKGLLPSSDRDAETDVLNGIAYDNSAKRIFVTGKRWPKLFEIQVTE